MDERFGDACVGGISFLLGALRVKVLVEIVHPADVLFYLNPIRTFQSRGDELRVVSRQKDVACDLLDDFGIAHVPVSRAGRGVGGLMSELLVREAAILRMALHFRPQVMLGFGGVAISHVGSLIGVPTAAHYDSENATLQTRITWPFVRSLTVPKAYNGKVPVNRTRYLRGLKELSYFHPNRFLGDYAKAIRAGLDPARKNIVLRLVEWRANHDIGKAGWTQAETEAIVRELAPHAKLHVSAEGNLPAQLEPYRYRGATSDIHHLVAFSDALIGESATMAAEAITLGVPALYAGRDFPGYTEELGREGLLEIVRPDARDSLVARCRALLEDGESFSEKHAAWIVSCPDWSDEVVAEADRMACAPW